jgi:RNA polymerase sigma-70 factor (ECF subfamily)
MQPENQSEKLLRLIGQYKAALWRLASSYEAEFSRREDLVQEIALGLWEAIPRFRGDCSERTWLYRIAHNIAISQLASRRKREHQEWPLSESLDRPGMTERPDSALVVEEKRQAMLAAIRALPTIDRQIIMLHLEDLSHEEIEEVTGLSRSAIATRLSRVRDRLAETIRRKEIRK